MSIVAGAAALKTAVELTRALRDAAKAGTIKPEEFAGRVGEIYDNIIDSKDALSDAKDEIRDLKDQLRALKGAADDEKRFRFMHGVYWKTSDVLSLDKDENGNRITQTHWDGPFCPVCRDVNGIAVRLKDERGYQNSPDRSWLCEIHLTQYRAPTMLEA
jgi:hypothetical protein